MLLLLLFHLSTSGQILSPVLEGSDDPERMFEGVVRVKESILIDVCGFPVYLDVMASVLFNVHCTVQKSQTIVSDILLCELDVTVH